MKDEKQFINLENSNHPTLTFKRKGEKVLKVFHKNHFVGFLINPPKEKDNVFIHPNIEEFWLLHAVGVIKDLFEIEEVTFNIMFFRCKGKRYKTTREKFIKNKSEKKWKFGIKYFLPLIKMECLDDKDSSQLDMTFPEGNDDNE